MIFEAIANLIADRVDCDACFCWIRCSGRGIRPMGFTM